MDSKLKRSRALRAVVGLMLCAGFGASLIWAFQLGTMMAFLAVGGGLLAYAVPATIFDWPRLTSDDVVAFFGWAIAMIAEALWTLIDW